MGVSLLRVWDTNLPRSLNHSRPKPSHKANKATEPQGPHHPSQEVQQFNSPEPTVSRVSQVSRVSRSHRSCLDGFARLHFSPAGSQLLGQQLARTARGPGGLARHGVPLVCLCSPEVPSPSSACGPPFPPRNTCSFFWVPWASEVAFFLQAAGRANSNQCFFRRVERLGVCRCWRGALLGLVNRVEQWKTAQGRFSYLLWRQIHVLFEWERTFMRLGCRA